MIAVTVGAASGCSGAQGASGRPDVGTPASSVSSSASVSPSPTASRSGRSSIPANARVKTAGGAESYFHFYFDRLNAAFVDPSDAALAGLSDPACTSCANLEHSVRELAERREHVSEPPYRVSLSAELPESTPRNRAFQFVLAERASTVVDATGATIKEQARATHLMEILLTQVADGWLVQDLAVAKNADQR